MAHLVQDGRQQIQSSGGCALRRGVEPRCGYSLREFDVVVGRCIDEPSITAALDANRDVAGVAGPDIPVGQVPQLRFEAAEHARSIRGQPGVRPARPRGWQNEIEIALG